MGNLSKDFDIEEFYCKGSGCCDKTQIKMNPLLILGIQMLRDMLGYPIRINSGARCERHNKLIGGAKDSQHVLLNAADLDTPKNMTSDQFADLAKKIPQFKNGGIGIYKTFVHVDVRGFKARWRG